MKYQGTIVDYVNPNGKLEKALVVGFEETVGFTLVNANDHDDYFICYRGTLAKKNHSMTVEKEAEFMGCIAAMIENGKVYSDEISTLYMSLGGNFCGVNPSGSSCVFS